MTKYMCKIFIQLNGCNNKMGNSTRINILHYLCVNNILIKIYTQRQKVISNDMAHEDKL